MVQLDRWLEAAGHFERLSQLDAAAQYRELERLAREDPTLHDEVSALLEQDDMTGAVFLDREPASSEWLRTLARSPSEFAEQWIDRIVGDYRIEEFVASGGMGIVFKARRADGEFDRAVALKMLAYSLDDEAAQRFRSEQQVLARLEHPSIARIYDAGATDDGIPYLVMEWVEGLPIDTYCDQNRLTIERRIELFGQLCEAVEWAHRHMVIHLDLKPANVLVDREHRVRLLDFGIAQLLDEATADDGDPHRRYLSAAWASPEQVESGALSVTSDVYSLGVLLYWLLCGLLPYRRNGRGNAELMRAIAHRRTISLRRTFDPDTADFRSRADARSTRPARMRRRLRGDLDAITQLAMSAGPSERYQTVEALRGDLQCYLARRPVRARSGGALYRTTRFVRRNLIASCAAAIAVLALGSLSVWALQSRQQMVEQRDRAVAKRAEGDQLSQVSLAALQRTLADASPSEKDATLALLEQQLERLDVVGASDPVRASTLHTLGTIYRQLGIRDRAESLLDEALALRENLYDQDSPQLADTREQLAGLLQEFDDLPRAIELFELVLEARIDSLGPRHPDVAAAMNNLGLAFWDNAAFGEAEPYLRSSLEIAREKLGPLHPGTLSATANLALVLQGMSRVAEAEEYHRQALRGVTEVFGDQHPRWGTAANNLGTLLRKRGRFEEAAELHHKVLDLRRRTFGEQHPSTAAAMQNIAYVEFERGNYDVAEPLMIRAREIRVEHFGAEHHLVRSSDHGLALVRNARAQSRLQ